MKTFSGAFCKGNVYVCPSKPKGSSEYMDYENCKLVKSLNPKNSYKFETKDMLARNYSWIITDDVTYCCFEVCSDQNCNSDKVNIGIPKCFDCNKKHCNVGDRFHYWQLGFNISTIQELSRLELVLLGKPLDCSIDCGDMDRSLGCKNMKDENMKMKSKNMTNNVHRFGLSNIGITFETYSKLGNYLIFKVAWSPCVHHVTFLATRKGWELG